MAATLLLSVRDAEIKFGPKILFRELTFNITEGDRISLVGKNGTGKSTLMRIIEGTRELDDGEYWTLPGVTIGHLEQEASFTPGETVNDYVFQGLKDADEATHTYKVDLVLIPLLLDPAAKMETLSGGQIRRANLARVLIAEPDILLLDEPTNHLDLEIIEWLEGFLLGWRGALVVVSHDRTFLANVSAKVFWLDRGKLKVSPKGFGHFDEWSTELLRQEQREIQNRSKIVEAEVEWANRGVSGRRKRNIRRLDQMKAERDRLRSDKHALARMLSKVEFAAPGEANSHTKIVADFHKVDKSYGDKVILDQFGLRLLKGDRVGIVGRNGSGKSSFLKLLVGEMQPDAGRVKLARDLVVSYMDQKKDIAPHKSLQEVLCPNGGDQVEVMGKMRHVASYLKDFLFDPRDYNRPVGTLSGGQKNRLMLAKIMANPGGLVVLDEPTNDLDMDTLDRLEDMLAAYKGTLVIVSHDRDFLDQTVTTILAFEGDGKVEGHIGGYADYIEEKRKETKRVAKGGAPKQKPMLISGEDDTPLSFTAPVDDTSTKPIKLPNKLKYELEKLPAQIKALEDEVAMLESALADGTLYMREPEMFDKVSRRLPVAKAALEVAESRWLELSEMASA